jgi:hypothetical protein
MTYKHSGEIDWRTSRYRTYARVYAPVGSRLISASKLDSSGKILEKLKADEGVENGRQWYGAFVVINPGQTIKLSFKYSATPVILEMIRNGNYNLLTQKQLGSWATELTLGLDFGTKVVAATPPEVPVKFGDNRYDLITDLTVDREFKIKL